MILLKSNITSQEFSCFPRQKTGTGTYSLEVKDQQTGSSIAVTSLTATESNSKVTFDFTMTSTDQRWYTIKAHKTISGTQYEIFRGVAFAYDQEQDAETFSIYYDYNTLPSANDNTYLTL